jgi:hypothetical protein
MIVDTCPVMNKKVDPIESRKATYRLFYQWRAEHDLKTNE